MTRRISILILSIYFIILFALTLMPYTENITFSTQYNMVFLKSIKNYLMHMQIYGIINKEAFQFFPYNIISFMKFFFTVSFKNLMGNIIIFFPFGYLIPKLFKRIRFFRLLIMSIGLSVSIEILQFIYLTSRRADVDDIILNVTGAIIGYLFFKIVYRKK